MDIKANATAHFQTRLSGELLSIDVPEWKATVFFKGAMSGRQQTQIFKLYSEGKQVEAIFMSLIMRALDEEGKPVWRANEMTEMMRTYDPDVISRIVEEMSSNEPTVEEAKKP